MFCEECGKKIDDRARFCEYCGTPVAIDIPQPQEQVPAQPPISSQYQPLEAHRRPRTDEPYEDDTKKNLSMVKKIILIALEICFFLPFCTVSCGNYSIDISGFTATFGSSEYDMDIGAAIYPGILFILPIIALILIFKAQSDRTEKSERLSNNFSLATGCIDLIVLFAFYAQITSEVQKQLGSYDSYDLSEIMGDVLSFEMGYYLEIILNALLIIIFAYQKSKEK